MAGISKAERAAREAGQDSGAATVQAPAVSGVEHRKHSATVTVGCKIPNGLRLQLQHKMERPMPTGRGMENDFQMVGVNVFGGPVHVIDGPAIPAMGGVPDGYRMPRVEAGVALTEVPRDFFEEWLHQNAKADFVINGMVFAYGDAQNVKAKAREEESRMSGLEPLSRHVDDKGRLTDRRVPKPITSSVGRIAFDSERDAARGNG